MSVAKVTLAISGALLLGAQMPAAAGTGRPIANLPIVAPQANADREAGGNPTAGGGNPLSQRTAQKAAMWVARFVQRRVDEIASTHVAPCVRSTGKKIGCTLVAKFPVRFRQRTVCRYLLVFRGADDDLDFHAGPIGCQSIATVPLRYGRAKRALKQAFDRLARKSVPIDVSRLGRLTFWAWGEWETNEPRLATDGLCYASYTVKMSPVLARFLTVRQRALSCEAAPLR